MTDKHSFIKIFPLIFLIFVDSIGMAILLPILNPLFMDQNLSLLPADATFQVRHFYYGVSLALFPLSMLFAAPVLGDISDHSGRKKILLVSLLGTFLSYLIMAFAIPIKSLPLFLFGRVLGGLTAGSQPIAQAAIIDITHPEHKAQNLSIIIGAASFGWVGGPILGGFLSDPTLASFFNPSFSLYFAAILSLINLICLQFFFSETLREKKKLQKLHLHKGPAEFILAFRMKNIRKLSWIFLIMQSGWAIYFAYVPLFLTAQFHLSSRAIGLFLSFMAIGFAIPSFGLIKRIIKYLTIENTAASTVGVAGVMFLLTSMATSQIFVLWPIATIAGFSLGICFSCYLTLFSNKVGSDEQGKIMGITTAVGSAGWMLSAFLGNYIANINASLPLVIGGILLLACSPFTYFLRTK